MSKGYESAFPVREVVIDGVIRQYPQEGLTKREYAAIAAMQALVAHGATEIILRRTNVTFADQAVKIADALLAELEKTS